MLGGVTVMAWVMRQRLAETVAGAVTAANTQVLPVPTWAQPEKLANAYPASGVAVQVAESPSGTGLGLQLRLPLAGAMTVGAWVGRLKWAETVAVAVTLFNSQVLPVPTYAHPAKLLSM